MDLRSAGMGIGAVLPVDQEDVHDRDKDELAWPGHAYSRPSEWATPSRMPFTKPGRAGPAEPVRQPDCLVDRHLRGHLAAAKLVDAESQNIPLDDRDPAHPPVLRGLGQLGIQCSRSQPTTPAASCSARSRIRGSGPVSRGDAAHHRRDGPAAALKLPGVEDLQRASPALGLNSEHDSARSWASASAVRSAAAAAS